MKFNPYARHIDRLEREQALAEPKHDGLAVAALVFAFLFWPLSILFGHLSNREAKRAGRRASVLARVGLWLSYLGIAGVTIIVVATIVGTASSGPTVTPAVTVPAASPTAIVATAGPAQSPAP
jgi:hypothetical protein